MKLAGYTGIDPVSEARQAPILASELIALNWSRERELNPQGTKAAAYETAQIPFTDTSG